MTRQRLIYRRLAIARIFHSRWIDSVREPFHRTLGRIPMPSVLLQARSAGRCAPRCAVEIRSATHLVQIHQR